MFCFAAVQRKSETPNIISRWLHIDLLSCGPIITILNALGGRGPDWIKFRTLLPISLVQPLARPRHLFSALSVKYIKNLGFFPAFIFQTEHSDPGVFNSIFMHAYIFDTCMIGHYIIQKKNYMLPHISYLKMECVFHYYIVHNIILTNMWNM